MKVTGADWSIELRPLEAPRRLEYQRVLGTVEAEVLRFRIKPKEMEDHWFVFEEDGVVHLVRSWTGTEIFTLQLQPLGSGGFEVKDVMVIGEPESEEEDAGSREILDTLLDSLSWRHDRDWTLYEHTFGARWPGSSD